MRIFLMIALAFFVLSCTSGNKQEVTNKSTDNNLLKDTINLDKNNELDSEVDSIASIAEITYPCEICSVETVKKVDESEVVSAELIEEFLCTFRRSCTANVEFRQYGTEVLYKILIKDSKIIIKGLKIDSLDEDYILNVIASPLLDYNYDELIDSIKRNRSDSEEISSKLILALQKAKAG